MELYQYLTIKPTKIVRQGHHHPNHRNLHCRRQLVLSTFSCSSTPINSHVPTLAQDLQAETLQTLEWNRVCNQLSAFTSTPMGFLAVQNGYIPMGRSLKESQRLLDLTTAALQLSHRLDFSGIEDVVGLVDSAVSGKLLSVSELCVIKVTLRSARKLLVQLEEFSFGHGSSDRLCPLLEVLQDCNFLIELEQKIEFCIDCNLSIVLDRASEDLANIRSERRKNMEILDNLLKNVSHKIYQAGGIDSPLVTNRRSRMCVAIRATHRSLLPGGLVLNVSGSGATYFMEPKEAMDLNNMEVRLENSEKDIEQAILSLLSSEIAKSALKFKNLLAKIQEVDLAVARAGHAIWLDGVCPILHSLNSDDAFSVNIEGIQHPLLLESSLSNSTADITSTSYGKLQRGIGVEYSRGLSEDLPGFPVPIDIKIGRGTHVVIISGPNAGGKTASMKTLGVASLMSKAGMYLPARGHPKLLWFDLILADIGDHQSLEENLSTFSGHILRIHKIFEAASKESLVLIDEIGSGTDPSEGVALSTSILQYLKDRVNLAVVTTHYADLSSLRDTDVQFENAAMEFSLDTLQPTYQILWGSAGESNALKIARTIGFDMKIIERAENWLGKLVPEKQQQRRGLLYQSLLDERSKMENQARQAASLHADAVGLYHEIQNEAEDLDWRETALIAKETQEVEDDIKAASSKMETVIQDFENKLRTANVNTFSSLFRNAESSIASIVENYCPDFDLAAEEMGEGSQVPQPGEQVQLKHLGGKLATVVEVSEDAGFLLVQSGKLKIRVDISYVKSASEKNAAAGRPLHLVKQAHSVRNLKNLDGQTNEEASHGPRVQTSKNTVDLRGMRVDEALFNLNMAIAAREPNSVLFIIHGMGTGVIKERTIEILRNHPQVVKFEQESPMNHGCTVAFIK